MGSVQREAENQTRPYWFVFKVLTEQGHPDYEDVKGAMAHVFIMETDHERAKKRAMHYLSEELWTVVSVEYEFEPMPEQLLALDEQTHMIYEKAVRLICTANKFIIPKRYCRGVGAWGM